MIDIVDHTCIKDTLVIMDGRGDVWQLKITFEGPQIRRLASTRYKPLKAFYEDWQ